MTKTYRVQWKRISSETWENCTGSHRKQRCADKHADQINGWSDLEARVKVEGGES